MNKIIALTGILFICAGAAAAADGDLFKAKNYSSIIGMQGFSDGMLKNHFKLYEGYVGNVNLLIGKIQAWGEDEGKSSPEYAELKRRFGWEFNGMRLHEYYFENMGGKKPIDPKSALYKKIVDDFGSYEKWKEDFTATGMMRGIGWVVLCRDETGGILFNTWIDEHNSGHLSGTKPVLVMDVFEHAYLSDYEIQRQAYIESFIANIDWKSAEKRFGVK